jgi:hypothetical protein
MLIPYGMLLYICVLCLFMFFFFFSFFFLFFKKKYINDLCTLLNDSIEFGNSGLNCRRVIFILVKLQKGDVCSLLLNFCRQFASLHSFCDPDFIP